MVNKKSSCLSRIQSSSTRAATIRTSGSRRNRYTNLLDDSTIQQPGPSTSAPIISAEISSQQQQSGQQQQQQQINRNSSNRTRMNRRRNPINLPQPKSQPQLSSSSENTQNIVIPSVQIVIADLHSTTTTTTDQQKQQRSSSVLIAPPQLSINCDSSDMDEQRTLTPDHLSTNEDEENGLKKQSSSSSSSTMNV
ncbi:hypothetical protein BLA29_007270 [Euroglyphus maynei]|uniref:Uncharacterized protein n=1 Tax=Euroglyphus maynei TaxID=6958 RepID=A0A1Y3BK89_EURMA|nr:hypothetical protein BLA29_007270 [Euroglyphus maynei]